MYESAPATKFLATHCVVCNKPLVDAESVERAMGATCASIHGYDVASAPANWERVVELMNSLTPDSIIANFADYVNRTDAHAFANRLVNRIVMNLRSPAVPTYIRTLHALGYATLALTIVRRRKIRMAPATARPLPTPPVVKAYGDVSVVQSNGRYYVATPFNRTYLDAIRNVLDRRWHAGTKEWSVPVSEHEKLRSILKECYPNAKLYVNGELTV